MLRNIGDGRSCRCPEIWTHLQGLRHGHGKMTAEPSQPGSQSADGFGRTGSIGVIGDQADFQRGLIAEKSRFGAT